MRASELINIVKSVALVELKESTQPVPEASLEPVVVLLPSANGPGKIFTPEERPIQYATANGIDLAQVRVFAEMTSILAGPVEA